MESARPTVAPSLAERARRWRYLVAAPGAQLASWAASVTRGTRRCCPVCHAQPRYFRPFGAVTRAEALCPACLSLERHRLAWLFVRARTQLFTAPHRLLHLAPEPCFVPQLRALPTLDYVTADHAAAGVDLALDLQRLALPDGSFDAVWCSHVLEHVPDDRAAIREMFRVLRPGGFALVMVPVRDGDETLEDRTLTPAERLREYGDREHLRYYGRDLVARLAEPGFDVTAEDFARTLGPADCARYGLLRELVFLCRKRAPSLHAT